MTALRRATALGAALLMATALVGCGKDSGSAASSSSSATDGAGSTSAPAPGGGTTSAGQNGSQNASQNGGATPQEAVQNVFFALATDNADKACRQMAGEKDGKKFPIAEDETQMQGCITNTTSAAQAIPSDKKPLLVLVQVNSASEKGDTATVSGKDMTAGGRPMDTMVTEDITLSKINGRWYVDVSSMFALAKSLNTAAPSA